MSKCRFITETRVGTEGFGVSYSAEKQCADELLKILPNDWSVEFHWMQIALLEAKYTIHASERRVKVFYNQRLSSWQDDLVREVEYKVRKLMPPHPLPSEITQKRP